VLASNLRAPSALALDEDSVYWLDAQGPRIAATPKGPGRGNVRTVMVGLSQPTFLARAGTHLFTIDDGAVTCHGASATMRLLESVATDGSGRATYGNAECASYDTTSLLADGDALVYGLALDQAWGDTSGPNAAVDALTLPAASQRLATQPGAVVAIVASRAYLYWYRRSTQNLTRYDRATRTAADVVFELSALTALAADATYAVWATEAGELHYFTNGTTSATTLAAGISATSLALHGGYAYFASDTGDTVQRVPLDGGAVQVIARGQGGPGWLTADASAVYWTNRNSGEVVRYDDPVAGAASIPRRKRTPR
jgi:hypothetical protein